MPSTRTRNPRLAVAALMLAVLPAAVAKQTDVAIGIEPQPPAPLLFETVDPRRPLILVEAEVDGVGPCRFLLDTGASVTIISPPLAETLGVEIDVERSAVGAAGGMQVGCGVLHSLSVGTARQRDVEVGIVDLTAIGTALDTRIDGIIGNNFLSKYRVTIDYPSRTITFE